MLDLEEKVRDDLRSAVDDLVPSPGFDELVGHRIRLRVRQRLWRRRLQASALVMSVLGVAAAGVAMTHDDDRGPSVLTGSAGDGGRSGGALFLVPETVPEGFEMVSATGGDQPGVRVDEVLSSEWDRTLRFVRFDAARERPAEVVDVQWSPGPIGNGGGAVDVVVRGRDGRYSAEEGWLEWKEPDGRVGRVSGIVAPNNGDTAITPLAEDVLREIAESLEPTTSGFALAEPPDGFDLVADWPGRASEGTNPRSVVYTAGDERGFQIHIVDDAELPPGINLRSGDARLVDVRGHDAVLTPALANRPDGFNAELSVQWIETDGARVTLGGTGLDASDLLAIARGLHQIDEATWFDLQPGGADEAGPSTSLPSEPVEPAPDARPATDDTSTDGTSPAPVHVEGTYRGTEHYSPTAGGCPDLDHVLVSTFELTDGSSWDYRSEYCGTLDGTHWTGAGTFEFTTPDGDTITGTTGSEGEVPSPGLPLVLTITGGTGAYEGASGSCDLDNHLTQVGFGTQEQYGSFACDITVNPPS
jgi:hypothetical protein